MKKKNRKLLLQMAVRFLLLIGIIAGVLAASVFFVSFAIFHGSQINMIDKVFNGIREQMEENPHMESLIDFWEEHPEDLMSDPDETGPENDEQTVRDTALLDDEDFSQLPFEEQTALAHSEYRKLTEKCGEYIDLFDFEEIFCIDVSDDHFGMVLFCEKKDRENESSVPGTNTYADYIDSVQLEKIINKEEDPAFLTKDGRDLYVIYQTVSINGKTRCVNFCLYDWTDTTALYSMASGTIFRKCLTATLILIGLMILYLYISVIRPLLRVQKNLHSYRENMNTEQFLGRMKKIHSRNEIGRLSEDLSDMIIRIKEYNDEEIRNTEERAKTEYELNLASRMQASMLPRSIPAINGYAIAASMNPAAYVAGDFYDLFMTDETHLVLVVADVTGKGVHAALLAAFAQTSIKYNTRSDSRPSEILSRLNQEICDKDLDGIFVTVWIGILDTQTGIMTTSNAGHEPPMLRTDGQFTKFKEFHGLPAGARRKGKYTDQEFSLKPGSCLFVYTDGVTDAVNKEGKRFGTENLENVLNTEADMQPEEILAEVRHSVMESFSDGAEQYDDITMLCISRTND